MFGTRVASARQVFLKHSSNAVGDQVSREASFFRSLRMPNGTRKTTTPDRLTDVDQLVCDSFEEKRPIRLLDVGISSGITTLELLDRFERRGIPVEGIGVDICIRGMLCSFCGIDVLYDSEGHVLQVATPIVARGRSDRTQRSLQSRFLGLGMALFESSAVRRWMTNSNRSRSLDLVSPRLSARRGFEIVEHDVAKAMPEWNESIDVVRIANVLNLDFFNPSQVTTIVANLTSWLKVDGMLISCRTNTPNGTNHGSVYRKQAAAPSLRRVHLIGNGYEIDSLVDESFCK